MRIREYLESELEDYNDAYQRIVNSDYDDENERQRHLEFAVSRICMYKIIIALTFKNKEYDLT